MARLLKVKLSAREEMNHLPILDAKILGKIF